MSGVSVSDKRSWNGLSECLRSIESLYGGLVHAAGSSVLRESAKHDRETLHIVSNGVISFQKLFLLRSLAGITFSQAE